MAQPAICILEEFLQRRKIAGGKITWLLGAGVSCSAGIPTAKEISPRILVFEDLVSREPTTFPWCVEKQSSRTDSHYQAEFPRFLDWYDALPGEERKRFVDRALERLRDDDQRKVLAVDSAEFCQLQCAKLENRPLHALFRTLMLRSKGVNIAHLALAGLLRDFPELTDTVFTTNFDDLVLQSLLSLGHTARIFGDLNSVDKPELDPKYPQIVHLHGRFTGYRLVNSEDQLRVNYDSLETSFLEHLKRQDLVVLGYAGWDDLVMRALDKFTRLAADCEGSIYWVPFQHERELSPNVVQLLERFPPGRAKIVVTRERDLDADRFISRLADHWRRLNGCTSGFAQYRQEFFRHARMRHEFLLQQLQSQKELDPSRGKLLSEEAKSLVEQGDTEAALAKAAAAAVLVEAEDLPLALRASVFRDVGIVFMFCGRLAEAIGHLNASKDLWNRARDGSDEVEAERVATLCALGDAYLRRGDIQPALASLKKAAAAAQRSHVNGGHALRLLGEVSLRRGRIEEAKQNLERAVVAFAEIGARLGEAQARCALATACCLLGDPEQASAECLEAQQIFTEFHDHNALSAVWLVMARLGMYAKDVCRAREALAKAVAPLGFAVNTVSRANISSCAGDLAFQERDYASASANYREALALYEDAGCAYGRANALASLLVSEAAHGSSISPELIDSLTEVAELTGNAFALQVLTAHIKRVPMPAMVDANPSAAE